MYKVKFEMRRGQLFFKCYVFIGTHTLYMGIIWRRYYYYGWLVKGPRQENERAEKILRYFWRFLVEKE